MKFKAPEGATSVNIGGDQFTVKNGFLTVPDEGNYVTILAPHGFVPMNDGTEEESEEEAERKAAEAAAALEEAAANAADKK